MTAESCSVVSGPSCLAPANSDATTTTKCFACGAAVCTSPWCSRIRKWGPCGRKRICRDCDEGAGLYADPDGRRTLDERLARA